MICLERGFRVVAGAVLIMGLLLTAGCGSKGIASERQNRLQVVATTGMVADLVQQVGKEHVEVTALMGAGVDPHLYKASQGDIGKLSRAQVIFYNGLNLEGKMGDVFVQMASKKPTVAISDSIPTDLLREPPEFNGHYDPHIWFDVSLWMKAAERVRDALAEADPSHKNEYVANAAAYINELQSLHAYAKEQIASIPRDRRVLITAHDAFGYFGRAYDIEVMALQGITTVAEYGLGDVQHLVNSLVERKIKAVFVESSVPKRSIEAVVEGAKAKGHVVSIGGQLFSDAMGNPGTPEGSYVGMVRYNVNIIVNALK